MSMNISVILTILGMALVTYIPRMLPAVVLDKLNFSPKLEKMLKLIPYTAMTALIFPGVISVDVARPYIGFAGGAVAAILAWLRCPLIVCVIAAIASDIIIYTLI